MTGMEIHAELRPILREGARAQIVIGPAVQGDDGRLQANAVPYNFADGSTSCDIGDPRMLPAKGWNIKRVHDPTFGILIGTAQSRIKNQEPIDPALVYVTVYFLPNWDTFDMTINLNL